MQHVVCDVVEEVVPWEGKKQVLRLQMPVHFNQSHNTPDLLVSFTYRTRRKDLVLDQLQFQIITHR